MKRTKILAMILVATTLIAAGCGSSSDTVQPTDVKADSSVGSATEEAEETEPEAEESTEPSSDVTLAETVIYDENNIKVTVSGMTDSLGETDINMLIENNTDQNLLFTSENVEANGYMLSTASLYSEVAAGKSANAIFYCYDSELQEKGINDLGDISFDLLISNDDTWEDLYEQAVTLSTSASGTFEQTYDDSGDVIYDNNGIRVICKGLRDDDLWDGAIVFYIENNTDQFVSVYSENVSVNGFMTDDSFWSDLNPGAKALDAMYLCDLENDVNITSIEEVENIEFSLTITDEDWNDMDSSEPITLNFD